MKGRCTTVTDPLTHLEQLPSAGCQAVVAQHVVHVPARQHAVKHLGHQLQVGSRPGGVVPVSVYDVAQRQHKLLRLVGGKHLQGCLQLGPALPVPLWPAIKADGVLCDEQRAEGKSTGAGGFLTVGEQTG